MLYCPGCNNTHWDTTKPRGITDVLAILLLQRPLKCTKCDRIRLGWIFTNFTVLPSLREREDFITCPDCGGPASRAPRRRLERAVVVLRAYRCVDCKKRFRKLA